MSYSKDKKQRLSKFDFSGAGAHVALVNQLQGGAANNHHALVIKSKHAGVESIEKQLKDVVVTLSFQEFLEKFFNIWYEDAALLASMLGFDVEVDSWTEEYIEEKMPSFSILKAAKEAEDMESVLKDTSLEDMLEIALVQEKFEKALLSSDAEDDEGEEEDEEINKSSDTSKDDKGNNSMSMTEAQIAELEKKAAQAEEMSERLAELEKSAKRLEELEKAQVELKKAEYVELVKGWSFVEEGKQESLSKALFDVSSLEGSVAIMETLEKAAQIAKEFGEKEHGVDGGGEDLTQMQKSKSNVKDILASRKNK